MKINETTQSLFTIATWITNKLIQTSTDKLSNVDLVWSYVTSKEPMTNQTFLHCYNQKIECHFEWPRPFRRLTTFPNDWQCCQHFCTLTLCSQCIFLKMSPRWFAFFTQKIVQIYAFLPRRKQPKNCGLFASHQPRHLLTLMVTALRLLAVMSNNISVVCRSSIEKLKNSPNSLHLLFHSIRPTVFKTSLCHVYVTIKLDDNPFRIYEQS